MYYLVTMCIICCAEGTSRIDVKKLEKQEAKLKAKIGKCARRNLHKGSKLLEQTKKQVRTRPFSTSRLSTTIYVSSNPMKRCS
jgi:hypothetical protein